MPKNKKQKEYSTSYEKKISINPMTEAFSMGEDESPTIGGAIAARVTKRVGEFTPSGRVFKAAQKSPKTSAGIAGVGAGTGVGYAAGRYDKENSKTSDRFTEEDIKIAEEAASELAGESMSGMKKGGKVKTHKMPGGKMMKDSDMKKKKKMGGGMMQDSMGYKKGGTVRGGRSEIKGTRPAKLY